MNLENQLSEDLKTAMKAKDAVAVNTLRMVRAQIKDTQIAKGDTLNDEEVLGILMSAAKKRKEAMDLYEKGDRQDLLDAEKAELSIISRYLPKQLSKNEIAETVNAVIQDVGASGPQDFGKVMGSVMKQLKGKADGKLIQEIVREQLS